MYGLKEDQDFLEETQRRVLRVRSPSATFKGKAADKTGERNREVVTILRLLGKVKKANKQVYIKQQQRTICVEGFSACSVNPFFYVQPSSVHFYFIGDFSLAEARFVVQAHFQLNKADTRDNSKPVLEFKFLLSSFVIKE